MKKLERLPNKVFATLEKSETNQVLEGRDYDNDSSSEWNQTTKND